jgi:hypothetical protein
MTHLCRPAGMLRATVFLAVVVGTFPGVCEGCFAPVRLPMLTTKVKYIAENSKLQSAQSFLLLLTSSEIMEEDEQRSQVENEKIDMADDIILPKLLDSLFATIQDYDRLWQNRPPMKVEDMNLLFYDIILMLNLAVSISFWVVHRMDFTYIGSAFNEGCLMSIMWIGAGLYSGAFLNSAMDGHRVAKPKLGGPKAAGILAFQAYINASSLRLLFSLAMAVAQHRPVGAALGEQIMPLEIGFGLIMISSWRILHSSFSQRL